MRPAEVGPALVRAAGDFVRDLQRLPEAERQARNGATLAELADRSCVGREAARNLVPKLRDRGHLQIVGQRKVGYRNRPVAEYAPVVDTETRAGHGWVDLGRCVAGWAR